MDHFRPVQEIDVNMAKTESKWPRLRDVSDLEEVKFPEHLTSILTVCGILI